MTWNRVRGKRRTFRLTTRNKLIALGLIVAGSWILSGFLLKPSAPKRREQFDVNFTSPGVTVVIPPDAHAPAPGAVIDAGSLQAAPGTPPAPQAPGAVPGTGNKTAL